MTQQPGSSATTSTTKPEAIDVREQVIEAIPITLAWRTGDMLFVRAAAGTPLSNRIRAIGARWDHQAGALALDTSHLERVQIVLADSAARIALAAELRTGAGIHMRIPYQANAIRLHARMLGGIWDPDSKTWLLPAHAVEQIQAELDQWNSR